MPTGAARTGVVASCRGSVNLRAATKQKSGTLPAISLGVTDRSRPGAPGASRAAPVALLAALACAVGFECVPAWEGNWTSDGFLACGWQRDTSRLLVVVNYAGNQGQCYVRTPFADFAGRTVRLTDLMKGDRYERAGSDLVSTGLYVDLPSWGYHVLEVEPARNR